MSTFANASNAAPVIDSPDTDIDTDTSVDDAFKELTGFEEQHDDGSDKDRFSHYAKKDDIVRAATEGLAITALCGKKWRPQRNPEKYPVCPMCKDAYEQLKES